MLGSFIFVMTFKLIIFELVHFNDPSKGTELQNESDSNCNCRTHTTPTSLHMKHRGYLPKHTPEDIHWWNVVCETLQPLKILHIPTAQKVSEFKCAVFSCMCCLFDVSCELRLLPIICYNVTYTMLFSVIVTMFGCKI